MMVDLTQPEPRCLGGVYIPSSRTRDRGEPMPLPQCAQLMIHKLLQGPMLTSTSGPPLGRPQMGLAPLTVHQNRWRTLSISRRVRQLKPEGALGCGVRGLLQVGRLLSSARGPRVLRRQPRLWGELERQTQPL